MKLAQNLAQFQVMQGGYMPPVLPLLWERLVPDKEEPEMVPLMLPSSLTSDNLKICKKGCNNIKWQLWDVQCQQFLNELHDLLFIKSRLIGYKDRNTQHQGANMRMRTLI
ncbi:hypothetical protein BDN71DRAFT_1400689 [Pleurotus eryngii]|uniref:Uncharacterized protein n=1 Tax=Pleurotus eryngii TaxID=5323 RepID=A0A9P6DBR4_PLEER|nr:hypothetical protein BDN71DRAFT_1400689 [Pleurotus eryngii]